MATLTIRKIDESTKLRLQARARRSGHSMEEEVRKILAEALTPLAPQAGLGTLIHNLFRGLDDSTARPTPMSERLGAPPLPPE